MGAWLGGLQSDRGLKERCRGFRNWFRISRFVMRPLEASLARWLWPDPSGFNTMFHNFLICRVDVLAYCPNFGLHRLFSCAQVLMVGVYSFMCAYRKFTPNPKCVLLTRALHST